MWCSLGLIGVLGLGCAPVVSEPPTTEPSTSASGLGVVNGVIKDSSTGKGPAGKYTVQVLAGKANTAKVTELSAGGKLRADFVVDPAGHY